MPSQQKLMKRMTKLKNQIISSSNYLQLQEAICEFNEIKTRLYSLSKQRNVNNSKNQQINNTINQLENKQLIQTTQQLIKQKIKFFKKVALNKIQNLKNSSLKHQSKQTTNQKNIKNKHKNKQTLGKDQQNVQNDFNQNSNQKHAKPKKYKQLVNSSSILTVTSNKKSKQIPTFSGSKQLNQLKKLQEKSALLQLQKTFVSPSSNKQRKSPSCTQKRLKKHKSVQNFFNDKIKQSFTFRNQQNNSNLNKNNHIFNNSQDNYYSNLSQKQQKNNQFYDFDDDNKTQIKIFNKKGAQKYNQDLEKQNVDYYKAKVEFLQKMIGSMQYYPDQSKMAGILISKTQNTQIFQQFHFKLREKALQLEQVRGRLKYHETNSQQLRNRVLNEQRRYQDYINSLKQHIKHQQIKLYECDRQKKVMNELIRQYELKIQVQQKQKIKLVQQIQSLLRQRQRSKLSDKNKTEDLRKELQIMATQQSTIRQLQNIIKQQKIDSSVLSQKNTALHKDLESFRQHLKVNSHQKQMLEQLLQLKLQQIEQYKVEVFQLKRQNKQMQEQAKKMIEQIEQMKKQQVEEDKRKQKLMRRKVDKLKQVKSLLTEDAYA